jgi:hypothetical protein
VRSLDRASDREDVVRRLQRLTSGAARRFGRMTAPQAVCHMADGFLMAFGRKPVTDESGPLRRTVVKWTALYLPLPWPSGIPTSAGIDQEKDGTCPGEFAADVARLLALVEEFAAAPDLEGRPHPYFGPLTAAEWRRWGWLHMDHHLRQFGV